MMFSNFFHEWDVGVHTESIQPRDDNSSSSEDDSQAPVPAATTSGRRNRQRQQLHQPLTTAAKCAWYHQRIWIAAQLRGHVYSLVSPRSGFALVPCGHARFCESCAMRMSYMDVGCHVCRADITMVMRIFLIMTDYAKVPWRHSA